MLIDRLAYMSELKNTDPLLKVLLAIFGIFICIWANSFIISAVTAASMLTLIMGFGKTKWRDVRHLLTIPASFVVVGSAAIALSVAASPDNMDAAVRIGGIYLGIGKNGVIAALRVMAKCLGAVSCMYFLSLTTPMVDLFGLLRKSIIPDFIVEIMELIYRYIFVLYDAANRIYIAQDSRLGYNTLKLSYHSTGFLAANLFVRAYRQAERTYTAMEARGYNGEIELLKGEYTKKASSYISAAVFAVISAVLAVICKIYGI